MSGLLPAEALSSEDHSGLYKNTQRLLSLEAALEILLKYAQPAGFESINIQSALGRVLAEDIYAPLNLPPFNRSPLDGYAVRAEDIIRASPDCPVKLKVSQEIPAGSSVKSELGRNQAAVITTGSPFPPGADLVIKCEDVRKTDGKIEVFSSLPAYSNYCFAGEDIQLGERVFSKGEVIEPASIGVLAGLGLSSVPVYRLPKVAIIGNGNELVDIHEQLKPGQIFDTNSYVIASYVRQMGARPVQAGTVSDRAELIAQKIAEQLGSADMIITTGGVSVGNYDLIKKALLSLGAKILFHRIAVRPGGPVLSAEKDGKLIICLSGNQAAAFVTFHLLALPALAKLMGTTRQQQTSTTAVLHNDYPKASKQRNFLRGRAYFDGGNLKVRITGKQNPGMIQSTLHCNALIEMPVNSPGLKAGEQVRIILLNMPGLQPN